MIYRFFYYVVFLFFFRPGPSAKILGPSEQIVREGSTVTITCESPPPSLVLSRGTTMLDWLHAGRLISLHVQFMQIPSINHSSKK